MSEFQAIILAAGRGSRMYPLTEDCPKALLPVGNQPLIWYPIQLLEQNGFNEALVVVRDSAAGAVSDALSNLRGLRIKLSTVTIPETEDWGTADSLRHIRNKIHSDVLLISCDLITTVPLRTLMDFHQVHECTLTSLLVREEGSKRSTERDIVGLSGDSRLVYMSAQADLDDHLTLNRAMLKRYPHIRLFTELLDSHLYLIKKWVVDHLADNREVSSVKGELVPYLVHHQSIRANETYTKPLKQALVKAASSCVDKLETLAYEFSSFNGHIGGNKEFREDLIRCHALLLGSEFTTRVNTLSAFTEANRMISGHLSAFGLEKPLSQPNWRSKGVSVSPDSQVASSAQLAEKVSVKKACIGEHCSIGERSKVINCVIMDHVNIGEGCSLQGCVVCSHARLEERVTLKDCYIGANFTITKEADMRGETLVVGGGLHF